MHGVKMAVAAALMALSGEAVVWHSLADRPAENRC